MSKASERSKRLRQLRADARELIDGRLVSTIAPKHGMQWIYGSYLCRCEPCTEANTVYMRGRREHYRNTRELIDGRWVAPTGEHGIPATYATMGCRCIPCTQAHNAERRADYRSRREG